MYHNNFNNKTNNIYIYIKPYIEAACCIKTHLAKSVCSADVTVKK